MSSLHLFEAFGVELEYMLVDRRTLEVEAVADQVLAALSDGVITNDFEAGPIGWSNELALHVLELKTIEPMPTTRALSQPFHWAISELDPLLESMDLCLLPTAMHPWMNPVESAKLWPHEYHEVYEAYDRIFDCRTHGWANVQSVHLNLPFCGDEEFARLHAAVRLILPLLPALAASSPIVEGVFSAKLDARMEHYAGHCRAVPSLTGDLIPEPVFDEATYGRSIFDRIYQEIEPHDPDGVLRQPFLNARGAIARFDRGSIEIRVMDVQEHPEADLAICAAVVAVLRAIVSEQWTTLSLQKNASTATLRMILENTIAQAENAVIDDAEFLSHFGRADASCTAGELWKSLIDSLAETDPVLASFEETLQIIIEKGSLSTRIRQAIGESCDRAKLTDVYTKLASCLVQGKSFLP